MPRPRRIYNPDRIANLSIHLTIPEVLVDESWQYDQLLDAVKDAVGLDLEALEQDNILTVEDIDFEIDQDATDEYLEEQALEARLTAIRETP